MKDIHQYCSALSSPPDKVLQHIERRTHLRTMAPQMMSGSLQGTYLTLLSQLLQPKSILEIGTFTAYGTVCLARGLAPGGRLTTIEGNPELEYLIHEHLELANLQHVVTVCIGDALKILPHWTEPVDMIFLDGNKKQYALYYDLLLTHLRPGGVLLADNVLWDGKVLAPEGDRDAQALHHFNQKVQKDERVKNLLLPLRDGLLIAQKLPD